MQNSICFHLKSPKAHLEKSDLLTQRPVSQIRFLRQEEGSSGSEACGHLDKAWGDKGRSPDLLEKYTKHTSTTSCWCTLTAVRLPEAVEHPQQRCLASACVSHHQHMRSLTDFQTQIFHQQLIREWWLVGQIVHDEGSVQGACMDIKVTESRKNKHLKYVPIVLVLT